MTTDLMARRRALLGPNVSTFYDEPLNLVRASGVHMWDASGRQYLDCYNNVPHVGHCHPHVVDAITRQASTLNTHTRYLHDEILRYGERLTAKFDHGLDQIIMTCSGSEANDIALRMAQAVTGKTGFIATDNTYHGNTTAVAQLSTRRPPIGGYPSHIRRVPSPDTLRPVGGAAAGQAQAFADEIAAAIADLESTEHGFAGFMFCPTFANEGLPDIPRDFMLPAAKVIRDAGGLLLADEVQPGFGRTGENWWGHDWLGIAPDVVTLGKPMANGHPVAAVVARSDVMADFRNAFGYFNTFGGNPVSCAAANATLDVIENEGLVENAAQVGAYFLDGLGQINHPSIANVRGRGLFIAMEVETDGQPDEPLAKEIVEHMVNRGVLMGKTGRHENALKLRPPMPFSKADADQAIDAMVASFADCPR